MREFIDSYFTFYYVGVTLFALCGLILLLRLVFSKKKSQHEKSTSLEFTRLNNRFEKDLEHLEKELHKQQPLPKGAKKLLKKAHKNEKKQEEAKEKGEAEAQVSKVKDQLAAGLKSTEVWNQQCSRVFVLSFVGNIMASSVSHLRDEITFLLQVANPADEIVVCLTSPGGAVSQYGLASSQLARLKQAGLSLTVCVDIVAASGGYMMAAVADKIIAAPFAILGSIGVVASIPNFHKVLQKNDIDYYLFTAGEYKRTVTPFAEVTQEGKDKFQQSLTDIHTAFKNHIETYRKNIRIDEVSTGEYWLATQAKEYHLVDEIMTSDDYLVSKIKEHEVIKIETIEHYHWMEKIFHSGVAFLSRWSPSNLIPHPNDESSSAPPFFH
ncbi:protease SohB [Deltaproteobacteria bacterium TL4]